MKNKNACFFLLLLSLILSNCSQLNTKTINQLIPSETASFLPGSVLTATPDISSPSPRVPSVIFTRTPKKRPLMTPSQTWTPRPTLPKAQAENFALNLLKTNGGCKLPCWIGITPGKTTWDEAYAFLATFAETEYGYGIRSENERYANLNLPKNSFLNRSEELANFTLKPDGRIDQIYTHMDIALSDLLRDYGPPTEVRLLAIGVYTMDKFGRYTLVLFYKEQGFMAVYYGKNERSLIIHICPDHAEIQQPWLFWDPMDQLTFSQVGERTSLIDKYPPPSEQDYIPIEKLTDLTPETFYQRYKDPKNLGTCMEMRAPDL
jgi:hypothetical protein